MENEVSAQYSGLKPYDLTAVVEMYAGMRDRLNDMWWEWTTQGWTRADFARHEREVARAKYWKPVRQRLYRERKIRVEAQILAATGKRHWEWFEQTLHDHCGDY